MRAAVRARPTRSVAQVASSAARQPARRRCRRWSVPRGPAARGAAAERTGPREKSTKPAWRLQSQCGDDLVYGRLAGVVLGELAAKLGEGRIVGGIRAILDDLDRPAARVGDPGRRERRLKLRLRRGVRIHLLR